jgi:RNA polymerase sigma factor (sigma-70 family)
MQNPQRSDGSFGELLTSQLPLIQQIITSIARRHRLNDSDTDEFRSWVQFKLVDNDYAVLRKYRGESNLRTYLTVVITHWCKDFRIAQWGKWRSSAAAKRLGPLAIELERLINRDGIPFDEGCEHLRSKYGIDLSDAELDELRPPPRVRPRQVEEQELDDVAADSPDAEELAMEDEKRAKAQRRSGALARLIDQLEPQDRLIVKLRFTDDMTVAQISRAMGLDQTPLYRHLKQLLKTLRNGLEDQGFDGSDLPDPEEPGPDDKGGIGGGSPSL